MKIIEYARPEALATLNVVSTARHQDAAHVLYVRPFETLCV